MFQIDVLQWIPQSHSRILAFGSLSVAGHICWESIGIIIIKELSIIKEVIQPFTCCENTINPITSNNASRPPHLKINQKAPETAKMFMLATSRSQKHA